MGNQIKACRKVAGMTQAQLAARLDVGQYVIAKWENGVHSPAPTDLARIAKILGVGVSTLFGEGAVSEEMQKAQPDPKTRAAQMQKVFEKLSPADQRAILKLARGLVK